MPITYYLERRQAIPRPVADVFAFFSNAANLEVITPRSLHFQILTPKPIFIQTGTLIDYRLTLFGVPFRWRTRIESFEPPHRFADVQIRGPYRLWRHTHEFVEQDRGTLMIDRVEYQLPLGPLGSLAQNLFVRQQLKCIFDHRFRVIEELLAVNRLPAGLPDDILSPPVA